MGGGGMLGAVMIHHVHNIKWLRKNPIPARPESASVCRFWCPPDLCVRIVGGIESQDADRDVTNKPLPGFSDLRAALCKGTQWNDLSCGECLLCEWFNQLPISWWHAGTGNDCLQNPRSPNLLPQSLSSLPHPLSAGKYQDRRAGRLRVHWGGGSAPPGAAPHLQGHYADRQQGSRQGEYSRGTAKA